MIDVQTNLQLYRQLIRASWIEPDLVMIRRGYELALQLFADAYRTSRRPFLAHLVGTASVLAAWGQRPAIVAAGLLHSAYLYGYFGDGQRGIQPGRRRVVGNAIGREAEQLVHDYTLIKAEEALAHWSGLLENTPPPRDQVVLQLANLLDDFRDGEPLFVSTKRRPLDLPWSKDGRTAVTRLAEFAVGPPAVADFNDLFADIDEFELPACLKIQTRQPRRVSPRVAELAPGALGLLANRCFRLLRGKRAA